jgi:hypothetical protein
MPHQHTRLFGGLCFAFAFFVEAVRFLVETVWFFVEAE